MHLVRLTTLELLSEVWRGRALCQMMKVCRRRRSLFHRVSDEGVIAAPVDGGAEEAKQSVTLCPEVERKLAESFGRDIRAGTKILYALMAEDRVSTYQSRLRRDRPIGNQRKSVEQEPQSFRAAYTCPNKGISVEAIQRTFQGLIDNDTYESADLPAGRGPTTAKLVYLWNANNLDEVNRGKARLVARGYTPRVGLDYLDSFSQTPVPSSIRLISPSTLQRDWTLKSLTH